LSYTRLIKMQANKPANLEYLLLFNK